MTTLNEVIKESVWNKLFIKNQFVHQGLEIGGQSFTIFLKFTYGEGGGLEGMCKGTGLHGEVHSGMRGQGTVSGNLLLDGPTKGLRHLFAKVISSCGISTLS